MRRRGIKRVSHTPSDPEGQCHRCGSPWDLQPWRAQTCRICGYPKKTLSAAIKEMTREAKASW